MSILHGKVDRQPVTLHETPRHDVIPAGDPRVTAALNVVRRHYHLPPVEEVSVFANVVTREPPALCERCGERPRHSTYRGTKYCAECAEIVFREHKADSARRSRECRRRRLEREAGV